MKIRTGFVSNSSSSSFIIASKAKLDEKKLTEIFKIPEDSPLHFLSKLVVESFIQNSEETSRKEMIEDYCCSDQDLDRYFDGIFVQAEKDGFNHIYRGSFSSENGGIESGLCELDFKFQDDQIIIWKEGGY